MTDRLTQGLRDLGPPVELEVPSPEVLLEGLEVPAWLMERACQLHRSEELLERVASVGFVARLGAALAAGRAESPNTRARAWASGIDTAAADELERRVMESADLLRDDLEGMEEVVVDGGEIGQRVARAACYRQDELESAVWVLAAAGRDDCLKTVAALRLSALDLNLDIDDDSISARAWQVPVVY